MADIVTLSDVKQHLQIPATNPSYDYQLQGFIYACEDVIQNECGAILPRHYDEFYDGGEPYIYLRHRPVLSVENVEEGWGWMNYELDYQESNTVPAGDMYAYSIDSIEAGIICRRSAGNVVIPFVPGTANIHVLYTAGRREIPGAIRLASLELVAHWFQSSQLRTTATNAGEQAYDAVEGEKYTRAAEDNAVGLNYGVPYRILELIKPFRRLPVIG